jgi:small neutral amino acid transporter SnatA (MarC family)
MKLPRLFRIVVALAGIVLALFAAWFCLFGIMVMCNVLKDVGHDGFEVCYVIFGVSLAFASIYFISGAPHLARLIASKNGRGK